MKYKCKSELWLYPGEVAWHFLSVDKIQTKKIKDKYSKVVRGFGSLPVKARIGKTEW